MNQPLPHTEPSALAGRRVFLAGKLAGMSKREAQAQVRRHGGTPVERTASGIDLVVIGEAELLPSPGVAPDWLDDSLRAAADEGTIEIITETQLWQRLGLVDDDQDVRRLYTPAMLASLLNVPVGVIRRWHRRGLIRPVREVRRLPYFDFSEVATARRLAELLAADVSPAAIEAQLAALHRWLPDVERPLAQLSLIVEGKHLLVRHDDGLIEPGGQKRLDFDASASDRPAQAAEEVASVPVGVSPAADRQPLTVTEMLDLAADCEDEGRLTPAAEFYRSALAAGGPDAETCFRLAEVLYRSGDLSAARERYFMATELDADYVEARANLGCVLLETGDKELAVAAFEGALAFHPEYADAWYLLARTLDELGRRDEALPRWRRFLELAAGDSPWTAEARGRLDESLRPQ
ncbi:MAG: tetratricopeptide repeat protein [Pirellulales bacterium]|nr:tetratricopeptide repeat protein [Pirellulales bacterium]